MLSSVKPLKVFKRAIAAYESGNLVKAAELCRATLERAPDHFDALHLLAVATSRQGAPGKALEIFEKAAALRPRNPDVLTHRAGALTELKRYEEALKDYDNALELAPAHAGARNARGNALMHLQRFDDALVDFGKALVLAPENAEIVNNLGRALAKLERHEEAAECFDDALALRPNYVDALVNRGAALNALKRFDEALPSLERALSIDPRNIVAVAYQAAALEEVERYEEAVDGYDRVVAAGQGEANIWYHRGRCLKRLSRFEEATASLERALARSSESADRASGDQAHTASPKEEASRLCERGAILTEMDRWIEAGAAYREALEVGVDYPEAAFNLGWIMLLHGNFREGWLGYEARRRFKGTIWTKLDGPEWRGESLRGKRLLLYGEQANGDSFQFVRFVAVAAAMGAEVILGVWAPLAELFRNMEGDPVIIRHGERTPPYDFHAPFMSAPFILKMEEKDIPRRVPYLRADPERVAAWVKRLPQGAFRIGVVWQGSKADPARALPLAALAPLSRVPGVTLISLQKTAGLEQLADLPPGMVVETLGSDFDAGPDAFLDSAAVMMNLDLIVSIDTGLAHLAGALGRPLWILLKHVPEWRWMLDRSDSPWYPTARLFRQKQPGDWSAAVNEAARELERLVGERGPRGDNSGL